MSQSGLERVACLLYGGTTALAEGTQYSFGQRSGGCNYLRKPASVLHTLPYSLVLCVCVDVNNVGDYKIF